MLEELQVNLVGNVSRGVLRILKEAVALIGKGYSVTFATDTISYEAIIEALSECRLTLLDARFHNLFRYTSLLQYMQGRSEFLNKPIDFLKSIVTGIERGVPGVLCILEYGSFLDIPYSLVTPQRLISGLYKMVGKPFDDEHTSPNIILHFVFQGKMLSSQELLYLLCNVPKIHIDGELLLNPERTGLAVPLNVPLDMLNSMLNDRFIKTFTTILKERNQLQEKTDRLELELKALEEKYSSLKGVVDNYLQAEPGASRDSLESAIKDTVPTSTPSSVPSSVPSSDLTPSALSVNTNMSWMIGTDYYPPPSSTPLQRASAPSPGPVLHFLAENLSGDGSEAIAPAPLSAIRKRRAPIRLQWTTDSPAPAPTSDEGHPPTDPPRPGLRMLKPRGAQ